MSLKIETPSGKTIGIADTEDGQDFVMLDNKKVLLSDVYQDEKLMQSFNDEIKTSALDLEDVTK